MTKNQMSEKTKNARSVLKGPLGFMVPKVAKDILMDLLDVLDAIIQGVDDAEG